MTAFLREVAWDLRGNRSNVILSFIALCVAMSSVVLVSVASAVGTDALVAHSEQVSGRPVTMQAGLPPDGWSREKTADVAATLSSWSADASQGALLLDHTTQLSTGTSATLRLLVGDYRAVRRITISSGHWVTDSVYPGDAVVNMAAYRNLDGEAVKVDLGYRPERTLTVVGVVSDGLSEPMIYASAEGVSGSGPMTAPSRVEILLHTTQLRADDAVSLMTAAARSVGIRGSLDVSRLDEEAQIRNSLATLTGVFRVVSLTGLVVAVIGMINVGVAGVRERARDFTIRRAMGATRLRIAGVVTTGTVVIGTAATVVSVGLSYAVVKAVTPLLISSSSGIQQPSFPWLVAAYAATGGLLASVFRGLVPAMRTRHLDLALLLRE